MNSSFKNILLIIIFMLILGGIFFLYQNGTVTNLSNKSERVDEKTLLVPQISDEGGPSGISDNVQKKTVSNSESVVQMNNSQTETLGIVSDISQEVKKDPVKTSTANTIEGFQKIFEISANSEASPRGYIDSSNTGQKFWVADEKLAFIVTYFDTKNTTELHYDGKILPIGSIQAPKEHSYLHSGVQIGGKIATVKHEIRDKTSTNKVQYYTLFIDGKEYASGEGTITSLIDYNGLPAYIVYNTYDSQIRMVVMYQGQPFSEEYPYITGLRFIGGKIAYLAQKNTDTRNPLLKLMWGEKEYGAEYDSVMGYIDSAGVPAYMAANFDRTQNGEIIRDNAQYLIRGDDIIFSGKKGEEMIQQERELADVGGSPAIIVRNPMTDSLYVFYKDKKLFEGYDIGYVRNVSGKLALLVGKDGVQYVLMEK
jgi:hypothetical protein